MADIQHSAITGSDAVHPSDFYQSADPGAVGADKSWKDTTTSPPIQKRRNSGDTGWDTVLDPSLYQTKSLLTTLGDLPYATASSTWARLAGNITTTKKFLRQTGSGAVSAAPAWDTLVAGDIPSLDAAKITTGTFGTTQIPSLDASKITSGRVSTALLGAAAEAYYAAHVSGGGGLDIWYLLGSNSNNAITSGAVTANTLYGIPFIAPTRGATLDRLGFNVVTLLAGNARVGLYSATSDTNLYPNALVVDGGGISTGSGGVKSATISQVLTPGALYWAVYLGDAAPSVRTHQGGTATNILGFDSSLPNGGTRGISVAQAYGALPATFPVGAALVITGTTFPAVFGRYSA